MFFDTHCHLDDPALAGRLDLLLEEARAAGIGRFVVPGVSSSGWDRISALAADRPEVLPAFGLHPLAAGEWSATTAARLDELLPRAVAVGEIGLDYRLAVPVDAQRDAFRGQLRLALAHRLPVLIHCRSAFGDLLAILREEAPEGLRGVMHAFSGSPETARECVALGLAISFAGPLTWENAVRPLRVAEALPDSALLVETDAPDLTPSPRRGEINRPAFLVHTARRLAEIRRTTAEEIARITTDNALRLFGPHTER